MKLEINPVHNPVLYAEAFQRDGRIQIQNFLTDESALALYKVLSSNKDWFIAYNDGDNYYESPVDEYSALSPQHKQQFVMNILKRAAKGFQYFFHQYYISDMVERGENEGHVLHPLYDFVNSEGFLAFMRALMGAEDITDSDSFASRYLAGHFLNEHDDVHDKNDRVAAYTISMTRGWKQDFGGELVFFDKDDKNTKAGFLPSYNTLNIFRTPQPHAVTYVTPYAAVPRLSVLGWLHRGGKRPDCLD